jgi:hypothetical protein
MRESEDKSCQNAESSPKVKAYVTNEGYIYEANGKRLGPFTLKQMNQPDFKAKIAVQIGVGLKDVLEAEFHDYQKEIKITELNSILASTVKHDEPTKAITFLVMLLAQTEEDQDNIAFLAESSTGKSYIPLQLIAYFPEEERRIYAGASPTSFFHEEGQWDKERKVISVDLERKILIFMDQPHWMLMEKLRPLLSHDKKVLTYKITDKREKSGLRTKTVEILGYPTVVFCTAKPTLEDQERTRLWLLSPEATQAKLLESLKLITAKGTDLESFNTAIEFHPMRHWLKVRIRSIRDTGVKNVVILKGEEILERFLKRKPYLNPRDQRDYPRLLRLIKGHALLNCFNRERRDRETIVANDDDIQAGFELYDKVASSNELGLSPEIYRIYGEVIMPFDQIEKGISRKEIIKKYFELYHRPLSDDRLRRQILPSLESAGLISQESNPEDRREILVYPTVRSLISPALGNGVEADIANQAQENRGRNSGVVTPSSSTPFGEHRQAGIEWLCHPENLDADGWADLTRFTEIVGGSEAVQQMLREGLIMPHPSKPNKIRLGKR